MELPGRCGGRHDPTYTGLGLARDDGSGGDGPRGGACAKAAGKRRETALMFATAPVRERLAPVVQRAVAN